MNMPFQPLRPGTPPAMNTAEIDDMAKTLFRPMGAAGVYARTAAYERVIEGLAALISSYRDAEAEILRFPPVMSRRQLEKSGYLKSFPNLLGCVCALHGSEKDINAAVDRFDKGGDAFYDQISALHKSVRGSHPDAALYWFCRMLDGGADPLYLARRIIRMASEDIGLADPRALTIALEAAQTYERLGSPEGELALANAAIYMAVAPKSNAGYLAYGAARRFVGKDQSRPVPEHLRNAPTKLMEKLGFGSAYRYAHDEPEAYAAGEDYFPADMPQVAWYRPTPRGLEQKIRDKLAHLRELDRAALKKK